MTIHVCRPESGSKEIARALAAAMPGDIVRLSVGVHVADTTLQVPSGVTLEGDGEVVLEVPHRNIAIEVANARDVALSGLRIRTVQGSSPSQDTDSDAQKPALILIKSSVSASIRSVSVFGSEDFHQGIRCEDSNDIAIETCEVSAVDGSGILLKNSTGSIQSCFLHDNRVCGVNFLSSEASAIEDNECRGNGASGIVLQEGSQAAIARNRCHDNTQAGILLFSSKASAIEDNECWGNGGGGIVLQRDSKSADAPSLAAITRNRCHDNTQAGIVLVSSEASTIEDNECWGNGGGGIVLQRDSKSADAPSLAAITRNRCHDNTQVGIVLFSSEASTIEDNECWGNGKSGIVLQRDSESADAPSRAAIARNRCHDNAQAGIVLFSSEASAIEDNECWGNGGIGIALQRDSESADAPSRAAIARNRCHGNTQAGIGLVSSEASAIEDNECWGNGSSGILLQRGSESAEAPSLAAIARNRCHDNTQAGILLFSSEASTIEDNECWGNGTSGIVLERGSETADAPSLAAIARNRCHENTEVGILLFSSEASTIEDNECWENGKSGILLQRAPETADAPSLATIARNRCHENAQAGIVLSSSEASAIADNQCWANGTSGIVLERGSETADAPSLAAIARNRCHDNAEAGIGLVSSVASAIEDNECWGNETSGILLQRGSETADAPSLAAIARNRCHDNTQAGIGLSSSDASAIADNECWGNGMSGIVLQRDSETADALLLAAIARNRCHDNAQAGIILFSSEASAIEDNECWGNGTSGIVLQRDHQAADAPSLAAIARNRCHDNAQAGIVLFSSEASAIEDNECWGNGTSGIVLQRGSESTDAPSLAAIVRNRCHDNTQAGIILFSSEASAIEDNECWGNAEDEPVFLNSIGQLLDPDPGIIRRHAHACSIPFETLLASRRAAATWGELAGRLSDSGVGDADRLATLFNSGPCTGCLQAWWSSGSRRNDEDSSKPPHTASELEGNVSSPVVHLDILIDKEGREIRLRRRRRNTSADIGSFLWDAVRQTGQVWSPRGGAYLLGVIDDAVDPIERIKEAWTRFAQLVRTESDPEDASSDLKSALDHARVHHAEVATPWIINMAPRNPVTASTVSPFLEQELLAGRSRAGERLKQLSSGKPLAILLCAAAVAAVVPVPIAYLFGFTGPLLPPWHAHEFLLKAAWRSWTVLDLWLPIAIVGVAISVGLGLVNALLPKALRTELLRLKSLAAALQILRLFDSPTKGDEDTDGPDRAWDRWVRRRVWANGTPGWVTVLCLRDADLWSRADIVALRRLIELRGNDQVLLLVVSLADRTAIISGCLAPWVEEEGTEAARIDLSPFDRAEVLFYGDNQAIPPDLMPQGEISDWLGPTGDARAEEARQAGIRDPAWSLHDLPAMLALGSKGQAPFVVARHASNSARHFRTPLEKALTPYVRLFDDTDADLVLAGDEALAEAVTHGIQLAPSILYCPTSSQGTAIDMVRLVGRSATRRSTAAALLNEAFIDDRNAWASYVALMAACGELHHLRCAVDLLDAKRPEDLRSTILRLSELSRWLSAAWTLHAEAAALGLGDIRTRHLAPWREAVSDRMDKLDLTSWTATTDGRVLRWAAARAYADRLGLAASVSAHTVVFTAENLRQVDNRALPSRTPAGCLEDEVKTKLSRLRQVDRHLAQRLLDRLFSSKWSLFPAELTSAIRAAREMDKAEHGFTLPEALAACGNTAEIIDVISNHGETAGEALAWIMISILHQLQDEGASPQKMYDVAVGFAELRENLGERLSRANFDSVERSAIEKTMPSDGQAFIDFVTDPSAHQDLRARLDVLESEMDEGLSLPGAVLGTFDPLSDRIDALVNLTIRA